MKRIVIIGAGPGGICTGIKLKEAGYNDFIIVEQADGVGGTWRHNSYPGSRCDVPSVLYSFSFAPKRDWSTRYALQSEILSYLEDVAEKAGLMPHCRFNTKVTGAVWNEDSATWSVNLDSGETLVGDVVVSGLGLFNKPAYPRLEGLDSFPGKTMHSARWDHQLDLKGKKVAVIGAGASAIQFIPEIAPDVADLYVYQRSPNWVRHWLPDYTPEEREQLMRDPELYRRERHKIWQWIESVCEFSDQKFLADSTAEGLAILEVVKDPETRAKLTPDFPYGAKRPLTSDYWLPTFNRPNVSLIADPIERISGSQIVARDGSRHEVDVIIFGTGFDTSKFLSAIPVTGRDGVRLEEEWEGGARAYHGISVTGFPNLSMLYGPNTNNGSIIENIEHQVAYAIRHIKWMEDEGLEWIDIRRAEMDKFNERLQKDLAAIKPWNSGTSTYYFSETGLNVTQWPHGMEYMARELSRDDKYAYDRSPRASGQSAPRHDMSSLEA